jgi:EAL domain-containing protein (putative c-di-GMP-specific phosphodiesterase class I)
VGEDLRRELSRPFLLQGQEIALTVSQGGALGCESATARSLFQQARTALAYAKAQGRDQLRIYNPEIERHLRRDATLEFQLRYALDSDELFLEYLPTVWLDRVENAQAHGRVIGVEALLRWRHRTEGVLMTADFLQAADHSGHSVALGDKAMEMVCRDFQSWHKAGLDVYANVHLSGRQLLSGDLVERAIKRVSGSDIPRDRMTFEFDERVGCLDDIQVDRNLEGLLAAGFRLAMSNFGEGACSLRRLSQVSFLKLSPSLLRGDRELCRQALALAAAMGKVAVGVEVENLATARFLLDNGCATVQGQPFTGPLKASEVLTMASASATWAL